MNKYKKDFRSIPLSRRSLFSIHCSLFSVLCSLLLVLCSCATSNTKSNIVELENKGTMMGVSTPDWLKLYLDKGLSALQAQKQYANVYCIVGEESGVNRQFVVSWADQASAQQRIGALLRTNIASRYEAAVDAAARSGTSIDVASLDAAQYRQEINNAINAVVNVSYSGAQREADWWSLRRRYDPDNKEIFADEYTAWVLYTVPKTEMNRQISLALETSVSADSALYDVTIALARDVLLQGYDEKAVQSAAAIQKIAADYYDPPGSIVAMALDEISLYDEYLLGRDVAASVLSNYRIWNGSPNLANYINQICQSIIINSPQPIAFNGYHAAILDSDEVNAFASPGGHIFVTRGLISAAKSEDALAAALAHEIAHVQLRHGLRAIQTNRDLQDWLSRFNSSGAQIVTDRMNAGFSRIQEFDADINAMSLLAATGYNPQGLLDMLGELDTIQNKSGGAGFNDTHPSPASRLTNAAVAAARYADNANTGNTNVRQRRFIAIP